MAIVAARPRREWIIRAAAAVGALALGTASIAATLANVMVGADPGRAHALAPWNGPVTAALAQQQFAINPDGAPMAAPMILARRALRQDPTAVQALTVLGLGGELRGDRALAGRSFAYSLALSRRELRPRIWAIEDAVNRGDIAGALTNYDIALRTSDDARGLLYPVLARALVEPKVRAALLPIIARRPDWLPSFVDMAATSGTDPVSAMQLFAEAARVGLHVTREDRAALLGALVAKGAFAPAWSYYVAMHPGAHRTTGRDPDFMVQSDARSPFDWAPGQDTGVTASILPRQGGGGLLDFSLAPSTSGTVVSQLELLPPGTYRLSGTGRAIDQPAGSRPYWSITCNDGRMIGSIEIAPARDGANAFAGGFTVPAGCTVQTVALIARPSDDIAGVSGQILHAAVTPATNTGNGK